MLAALLAALDRWLAAPPATCSRPGAQRDALRGEPVRWDGRRGHAAGIDDSGALLVETDDGRVTLDAGEVHLLR